MFNGGKKHRRNDLVVPLEMERNSDPCHFVVVVIVVVVVCVGWVCLAQNNEIWKSTTHRRNRWQCAAYS